MSRLPSDEGGPRAHDDKHGEPVDDQYEGRYSGGLGEVEPPHGLLQLQTTTDPGRPPGCQPSIFSNQYGITHKLVSSKAYAGPTMTGYRAPSAS